MLRDEYVSTAGAAGQHGQAEDITGDLANPRPGVLAAIHQPGRRLPPQGTSPHGLALLCTGQGYTGHTDKTVYVSGDLGATWKLAGQPSSAGDGGVIAASTPGHLTIATTSAASWLYYSADNGKTWRTVVTYPDSGQGWNDLGFTTTHDGLVIHGHPYYGDMLGQLLLTGNGGQRAERPAARRVRPRPIPSTMRSNACAGRPSAGIQSAGRRRSQSSRSGSAASVPSSSPAHHPAAHARASSPAMVRSSLLLISQESKFASCGWSMCV
jgi:hypothetical protein